MRSLSVALLVEGFFGLVVSVAMASATTPTVTVSSPAKNFQGTSPVHYVATASSPQCASGISAMRIYTAPHEVAYTVKGGSLDTAINLSNGTHYTVVQAWDNCGGVGKTFVTINVTGQKLPPPRFVYSTDQAGGKVNGFLVNPMTGSLSPTGQMPQWAHWRPTRVVADAGGYRLYVINADSKDIDAYFIDRRNGYINPVPGTPFPIGQTPDDLRVHPSGRFVYVTVQPEGVYAFAVQSDGSLTVVPGSPFATQTDNVGPYGLAITPDGKYLYVSDYGIGKIDAFSIESDGSLLPVPGSPFTEQPVAQPSCSAPEIATDATGNFLIVPRGCVGATNVYKIDHATGAITDVAGSPFPIPYHEGPGSLAVDPLDRFVFLSTEYCFSGCTPDIQVFSFNSQTGAMKFQEIQQAFGVCGQVLRSDPSGIYLYGIGDAHQDCNGNQANPSIWGMSYNQSNGVLNSVPGSPFPSPNSNYEFSVGLWVTP